MWRKIQNGNFVYNWINAHKFKAVTSSQGWIGVNLKLSEPFKEPYTIVIWSIKKCGKIIDKFHQIKKNELVKLLIIIIRIVNKNSLKVVALKAKK